MGGRSDVAIEPGSVSVRFETIWEETLREETYGRPVHIIQDPPCVGSAVVHCNENVVRWFLLASTTFTTCIHCTVPTDNATLLSGAGEDIDTRQTDQDGAQSDPMNDNCTLIEEKESREWRSGIGCCLNGR